MITQILLISPENVRNLTNLDENINGKILSSAITEATDIYLREILGDKLIDKIKDMVENNTIDSSVNTKYKTLLDKSQYYLAYTVAANVTEITYAKVSNAGVRTVNEDHSATVAYEEMQSVVNMFRNKSDFYCKLLQDYILQNRTEYSQDLTQNKLHAIHNNLYSAASNGIWLGGPRSKRLPRYTRLRDYYDHK